MEAIDENFMLAFGTEASSSDARKPDTDPPDQLAVQLLALFRAQCQSRHLDFAARWLQSRGKGFYTIASAGHESNAAVGLLSLVGDPALLHYRSGGFYAARAAIAGNTDPIRDVLRSLASSSADPITAGRHKVFGHFDLNIIPQTTTISSHLPRTVGLAFSLGLAHQMGRRTPWSPTAIVVSSFGDASINHSTATGAFNAAAYLAHSGLHCPTLFVCEDNSRGFSTQTARGWTESVLRSVPCIRYFRASGHDPVQLLSTTAAAIAHVRERRAPAVLHIQTVRFLGHTGPDVETAYRSRSSIQADYERDPLIATGRALIAHGYRTGADLLAHYSATRRRVMSAAEEVGNEPRINGRAAVMAPLTYCDKPRRTGLRDKFPTPAAAPATREHVTLAQAINLTLADAMGSDSGLLVFGGDVAVDGGLHGVTRGLRKRFGSLRVFDTLLDEQTILGTALGASLAGFTPIPEIQYLAYLHSAEDQLRGEAASLRFFSDGHYENGVVVRIAGLAYQLGYGGHFHNDNSVAVLRDIPGVLVAVPSHPADAPGMLRTCIDEATSSGRVCVFLEPIARYHTRDLFEGDAAWTSVYRHSATIKVGEVATYGAGDLLMVTFGNGVYMSRRAAKTLSADGISCCVLDLRWITPLPLDGLLRAARSASSILVVDETRHSAGVGEAVMSALVEAGCSVPLARVASADSFIPLGPASESVVLMERDIIRAARRLAQG